MSGKRLRPRFRIVCSEDPKVILERIQNLLPTKETVIEGQVVQEHAFLRIPVNEQHYWSPELHVWVRGQDGETIVYGVMGPKPRIWTMFVFFYTAVLTSAFFGSSYGIIQILLGMKAPFLWSIPLGIIALFLVYGAAQYGQHKGRAQMKALRSFLDEALKR